MFSFSPISLLEWPLRISFKTSFSLGVSMKSPEKLVEEKIRGWCLQNQIWVEVFDSKGSFSKSANRFVKNPGIVKGCPDLVGLNNIGLFVAIELKALNHDKVCRLEQRQYLVRVIEQGGFGIVTASVDHIDQLYKKWIETRSKELLLNELPKKVLINKKIVTIA